MHSSFSQFPVSMMNVHRLASGHFLILLLSVHIKSEFLNCFLRKFVWAEFIVFCMLCLKMYYLSQISIRANMWSILWLLWLCYTVFPAEKFLNLNISNAAVYCIPFLVVMSLHNNHCLFLQIQVNAGAGGQLLSL